jgi:uncharacterized SAM-binding protein YcdF (DUF218 family)
MKECSRQGGQHGGILTDLIALLFLVAVCVVLYFVRHPILRFAAESWIMDEPAPHADAIVVLGDDNFYADRATRAAELFRRGVAPVVVASGRRLRPNAGVSELMEHDLVERGVPKEKIIGFIHDADSTREEAEALANAMREHRWKAIVLVTSNYHTRRARYIFARVLPSGVAVSVASARDGDFDPERWWENRKSVKLFTHELIGMVDAAWELRNGKGPAAESGRRTMPGAAGGRNSYAQFRHIVGEKVFVAFTSAKCRPIIKIVSRDGIPATNGDLERTIALLRCPHVA